MHRVLVAALLAASSLGWSSPLAAQSRLFEPTVELSLIELRSGSDDRDDVYGAALQPGLRVSLGPFFLEPRVALVTEVAERERHVCTLECPLMLDGGMPTVWPRALLGYGGGTGRWRATVAAFAGLAGLERDRRLYGARATLGFGPGALAFELGRADVAWRRDVQSQTAPGQSAVERGSHQRALLSFGLEWRFGVGVPQGALPGEDSIIFAPGDEDEGDEAEQPEDDGRDPAANEPDDNEPT